MRVAAASSVRLRSITFLNPDVTIFDGVDENGASVRLLHHTQISLLLLDAMSVATARERKRTA